MHKHFLVLFEPAVDSPPGDEPLISSGPVDGLERLIRYDLKVNIGHRYQVLRIVRVLPVVRDLRGIERPFVSMHGADTAGAWGDVTRLNG